jgi:hypothetical protein
MFKLTEQLDIEINELRKTYCDCSMVQASCIQFASSIHTKETYLLLLWNDESKLWELTTILLGESIENFLSTMMNIWLETIGVQVSAVTSQTSVHLFFAGDHFAVNFGLTNTDNTMIAERTWCNDKQQPVGPKDEDIQLNAKFPDYCWFTQSQILSLEKESIISQEHVKLVSSAFELQGDEKELEPYVPKSSRHLGICLAR